MTEEKNNQSPLGQLIVDDLITQIKGCSPNGLGFLYHIVGSIFQQYRVNYVGDELWVDERVVSQLIDCEREFLRNFVGNIGSLTDEDIRSIQSVIFSANAIIPKILPAQIPVTSLPVRNLSQYRRYNYDAFNQLQYEAGFHNVEGTIDPSAFLISNERHASRIHANSAFLQNKPLYKFISEKCEGQNIVGLTDLYPFDFGYESIVLKGMFQGKSVIVKVPMQNYVDTSCLDIGALRRRRKQLLAEADILYGMPDSRLPSIVSIEKGRNPFLPSSVPKFIRDDEVFLIIEFIEGVRFDILIRQLLKMDDFMEAERLCVEFCIGFLELQIEIQERLSFTSIYTDIKPENSIYSNSCVRFVDGGSIFNRETDSSCRVSRLYLPLLDLKNWDEGRFEPDEGFVCRALSRATRIILTNCPAVVGEDLPEWPNGYSKEIKQFIHQLKGMEDLRGALKEAKTVIKTL